MREDGWTPARLPGEKFEDLATIEVELAGGEVGNEHGDGGVIVHEESNIDLMIPLDAEN